MFLGTEAGAFGVYSSNQSHGSLCLCVQAHCGNSGHAVENFPCIEYSVLTPESFCVLTSVSLKVSSRNIKSEFLPIQAFNFIFLKVLFMLNNTISHLLGQQTTLVNESPAFEALFEILSMAPQLKEDYLALPYHLIKQAKQSAVVALCLLLGHYTFQKLLI